MSYLEMYLIWWRGILHQFRKKPVIHKPTYREVFTTLTSEEAKECLHAYEVWCAHYDARQDMLCQSFLAKVANKHYWDYDTFVDIIEEEYETLNSK